MPKSPQFQKKLWRFRPPETSQNLATKSMKITAFFDWQNLLWGESEGWFLLEIVARCVIMFAVVFLTLRIVGKRGVKQVSIFEMIVVISLGSAAGDSMMSQSVGLVPATTVFLLVILLYKFITSRISLNPKMEELLEGKPTVLVKDGKFNFDNFASEDIAYDEFFTGLRLRGVSHLGQVKLAILETTGEVSVFFFPDKEVKPGLPILPDEFENSTEKVSEAGFYACCKCGEVAEFARAGKKTCKICKNQTWVKAADGLRIN